MPDNILFYFVFLSQIILISFYFPRQMLKRMKYVLATYPPAKYPNLYPKPSEYYEKVQRYYKNSNLFILLVGLFFMAVLLGSGRTFPFWSRTMRGLSPSTTEQLSESPDSVTS